MSTNVLDLQALTAASAKAVDNEHLVARTLVPPSDDRDDDLEKLWLKEREGAAVEVGARKGKPKASLAELLERANAFITAPLGRGKTSLRGLLARDLQPARSLLWVEYVPGAPDLTSSVERTYASAPNGQPVRQVLAESRPVIAIDDWDHYSAEQRRAFDKQAGELQREGSAFLFLGTSSAPPPRLANTRPFRLLPLTPADCTAYLYKRLEWPARANADDLANRLSPISREAFFISVIADYFASGRVDAEDVSLVALMREQMDAQLGSRCASSERAAIGPWLKRLALQGAQITFESAVAAVQAIAPSVDPSSLLRAASDAGFLVRRTMGQYEFSHALWRAFVVVDSFDPSTGWVEGPSDDDEEFARAQARLLPLAKTQEPQRTEILRGYAKTDLSAYMAAVSTLNIESYDRGVEQYVRAFVAGVEDIAQLLSSRARAFVEPWNGYPETDADGVLGAVYGNGTFEMRVRKPGEAQLIPVADARERTQFTPPAAVARGIGTSRLSGAKLCLEQLRSLWKSNVLPIIEPLAREQLFFWARALEMHATARTVADLLTLANENTDNLLFDDDAWIDGEYLARWHRLNQRQAGFGISGPELLRLVSLAKVDGAITIESLGHPGPDASSSTLRPSPRTKRPIDLTWSTRYRAEKNGYAAL
jgi:hypothetical protein